MFKKYNLPDKLFKLINITLLTAFAFICLYPFYYIFICSLSSASAISKGVYILPREFTLETYFAVFRTRGLMLSVFISVSRTILGTGLTVLCSTFVAYLFTYKEVFFRKFLYRFLIITMYFGAGLIPYYILIVNLRLINNFLIYIIPGAVSAYFVILVKTYIESIPSTLQESAEIDGAGIMQIFIKVIFPLCTPILACIVVFAAVGQWNVWSDTLYFINDSKLYTLQYKLYNMLQSNMAEAARANNSAAVGENLARQITPASLRLTMTFITIFPILCVYPIMQKYFIKGMMLGAVKG